MRCDAACSRLMTSRARKRNSKSSEDELRTSKFGDEVSRAFREGEWRDTASPTELSDTAALTNGWDSNTPNLALAADAENDRREGARSIGRRRTEMIMRVEAIIRFDDLLNSNHSNALFEQFFGGGWWR